MALSLLHLWCTLYNLLLLLLYFFSGIIGIVWFIFWLFFAFESPASHPRISSAERKYIETSIIEIEPQATEKVSEKEEERERE